MEHSRFGVRRWSAIAGAAAAAIVATDAGTARADAGANAGAQTNAADADADEVEPELPPFLHEPLEGGDHWRFESDHGPVHVFRPGGYRAETAGVVVYVHGYYTDVDTAWEEHHLAAQFRASEQNALFVVPEAPKGSYERVKWTNLGNLLREVRRQTSVARPWGPTVVLGHSGAYRTVLWWLGHREVDTVVLLDAMYGEEHHYARWLETKKGGDENRLINIATDTLEWSEHFIDGIPNSHLLERIPGSLAELSDEQREAPVLYIRSQLGHSAIVWSGDVIPMILGLARLPRIDPALIADVAAAEQAVRALLPAHAESAASEKTDGESE